MTASHDGRLFETPRPPVVPSAARGDQEEGVRPDMPLAARLRPRTLDELVGQSRLLGDGGSLRAMLQQDRLHSVLLWGPPGTGKTSIARVIAATTSAAFVELSAVTAGVRDVRAVIETARERRASPGRRGRTVLFIDEIHRFNRTQQDALLPAVEDGVVTLVGATTQNPSFEVNAPLRSRSVLLRLHPLDDADVRTIVLRAVDDPRGLPGIELGDGVADLLAALAGGDARVALTALETAAARATGRVVTTADVQAALAAPVLHHDRAGDSHYDQLSAFIKSMRGSDPDAAVYWLVRLLASGEDPRLLVRRMLVLASEDVGLADPSALQVTAAAAQALDVVGLPEARLTLVQATLHLALAPKSRSVTRALAAADEAVARSAAGQVPTHLRDAHSRSAAASGRGAAYRNPHDDPSGWVAQEYGPVTVEGEPLLEGGAIYRAGAHGVEPDLAGWVRARRSPPRG